MLKVHAIRFNFVSKESLTFFQLLSKTLDEVNDEEWTCELGSAMGRQISLYPTAQQEEKVRTLFACEVFGAVLLFFF